MKKKYADYLDELEMKFSEFIRHARNNESQIAYKESLELRVLLQKFSNIFFGKKCSCS